MLGLIRAIPGPYFLLIYLVLMAVGLTFAIVITRFDRSRNLPLPPRNHMDPYSLAYLRGSWLDVMKTVIFTLWEKSAVQLVSLRPGKYGIVAKPTIIQDLDPLENILYYMLDKPVESKDLFKLGSPYQKSFFKALEPRKKFLEENRLIFSTREKLIDFGKISALNGPILLFGLIKMIMGYHYNKPSFFLFMMLIVHISIVLVPIYIDKKTYLGRKFLSSMKTELKWYRTAIELGNTPGGVDPAYAMALWGTSALASGGVFMEFNEMMNIMVPIKGSGSGFTGGGCSSCGGGCGGCGGCGG